MNTDEKACPACAETVKSAAKVCRYCRYEFEDARQTKPKTPTPREKTRNGLLYSIMFAFGIATIAIVIAVVGADIAEQSGVNTKALAEKERLIADAREKIKETLVDPSSVELKADTLGNGCVSGEYNAKNRMGGYVGFTPFYYDANAKNLVVQPPFPDATTPIKEMERILEERSAFMRGKANCYRSNEGVL